MEYGNTGAGADSKQRVAWSRQLTKKEAASITLENVFTIKDCWNPEQTLAEK